MTTQPQKSVADIARQREAAENQLAEAKSAADGLRATHAQMVLQEQFPGHSLAVFARAWDEDSPRLIQLLSSFNDVPDVEVGSPGERTDLSADQARAVSVAESAICAIGADDDILQFLDYGSEEHDDWYEFNLPLGGISGEEIQPVEQR